MKSGTHVDESTLHFFPVNIFFQMAKNLQTQAKSGTGTYETPACDRQIESYDKQVQQNNSGAFPQLLPPEF